MRTIISGISAIVKRIVSLVIRLYSKGILIKYLWILFRSGKILFVGAKNGSSVKFITEKLGQYLEMQFHSMTPEQKAGAIEKINKASGRLGGLHLGINSENKLSLMFSDGPLIEIDFRDGSFYVKSKVSA